MQSWNPKEKLMVGNLKNKNKIQALFENFLFFKLYSIVWNKKQKTINFDICLEIF